MVVPGYIGSCSRVVLYFLTSVEGGEKQNIFISLQVFSSLDRFSSISIFFILFSPSALMSYKT